MRRGHPNLFLAAVLVVPQTRPAIEVIGFHLVEAQGQKRSIEIQAQSAKVYKPSNLMALDVVRALVWGKSPKPFEVTGDYAVLNSDTQDLEIHKRSRVISPDGFLFRTSDAYYKSTERLITSEDNVEATQIAGTADTDTKLTGKGLVINLNKTTYEIRRNVRTEQKLASNKPLVITAANLVIEPDRSLATFRGKALVKSPDFNLRGEQLVVNFDRKDDNSPFVAKRLTLDAGAKRRSGNRINADMKTMKIRSQGLTIDLDPAGGGVQRSEAIGQAEAETEDGLQMHSQTLISDSVDGRSRVIMKGEVSILSGTRRGTCQEATYYPDTGDIVLEHIASVTNETQTLEGERIRFSTKRSDITVEKAKGAFEKKDLLNSNKKEKDPANRSR